MKLSLFHDLVAWSSPCEDIQGRFLIIDMMCGRNIISEKVEEKRLFIHYSKRILPNFEAINNKNVC